MNLQRGIAMRARVKHRKSIILFLSFLPGLLSCQTPASTPAAENPPDLHFVLRAKEGRTQFRLGETIEIQVAYSSDIPDKYLWIGPGLVTKVKDRRSAEFALQPPEHRIDRVKNSGVANPFLVLHAHCGAGVGGGVGSGCSDCDGQISLKPSPVFFPYSLTAQFQILEPGHYLVRAQTADVIQSPLSEESHPIPLVSNEVEFDVVADPLWSTNTLRDAVERFEKAKLEYTAKGWDKIPRDKMEGAQFAKRSDLEYEMQQAAETMRVLDTEESLAELVRHYDGLVHEYDYAQHILYRGIIQSRHQALAIKLLSERILEPDSSVSREVLDQLTGMALRNQFPDLFNRNDADSWRQLYPAARKILHDYVLALGKSLAEKKPDALTRSVTAFRSYAAADFCTGKPLVPASVAKQLVQHLDESETDSQH